MLAPATSGHKPKFDISNVNYSASQRVLSPHFQGAHGSTVRTPLIDFFCKKIYMAAITSIHKLSYADNSLVIAKGQQEHPSHDGVTPPVEINMRKSKSRTQFDGIVIEPSVVQKHKGSSSRSFSRKFSRVTNAFNSSEKHLKFLDSYLEKLHGDAKQPSLKFFHQRVVEPIGKNEEHKADSVLQSLENYLDKVKSDAKPKQFINKDLLASTNTSAKSDLRSGRGRSLKNYMEMKSEDEELKQKSEDKVSDFYIIGLLASINIAVFLFEMATPVKNSNFELLSLPMVYGAKINTLILTGEWWRLVTPMFLHSGFFHISLGSWVLFTFGLQVSQDYGSFTFLLIYLLGGITGNLISYLHTPEPTVGGMGPVFAIIGAWLIYQIQNKDAIPRDATDKMFENAIIMTALSFVLSNFSPTDNWAHFAAAFIGVAYGFLTCPTLRLKDVSTEASRQKRVTLVKHYADPCKSLVFFSVFLLLLSSLLLVMEPPLDLTE